MALARDESLEERIADIAFSRFGHRPLIEKYYSENNYVCRLSFEGSIPDRVIKVGLHLAPSVMQEAEVLRRLRRAGLEVPEVEFTDHDVASPGLTFFVMPHLGDLDLGQACAQDLEWADHGCRRAGEFVARLQALPLAILDGLSPQHYTDLNTEFRGSRWAELRSIPREGHPGESLVEAARTLVEEDIAVGARVVAHESFIPGQVLTDGADVFAVTDWETIRAGTPLQDPSCFGAGLRAWYGRRESHYAAFIDGATGGAGLTKDVERRCRAWQCYRLFWWAEFGLRSGREDMANFLLREAATVGRDF